MECAGRWVEEIKVGGEGVEKGGGEWVLGCKAVAGHEYSTYRLEYVVSL